MGEDRFNVLMLLYVHKNIDLNIEQIVTVYAQKHPRQMLLLVHLCASLKCNLCINKIIALKQKEKTEETRAICIVINVTVT